MKKMIDVFFFLLFLNSCYFSTTPQDFKQQLEAHLFGTTSIKIIKDEYGSYELIERPFGTWIPLIEFRQNDNINDFLCLYYQTPITSKKGTLSLLQSQKGRCLNPLEQKPIVEMKDISLLRIKMDTEIEFHQLELHFLQKAKKHQIILSFPNLSHYADAIKIYIKLKQPFHQSISRLNTSYETGNQIPCLDLDIQTCRPKGENHCHLCQQGAFPVIKGQCKQEYAYYCSTFQCGQKNNPACIRGAQYTRPMPHPGCTIEGQSGICAPGLKSYCSEENILVCL